MDYSHGEEGQVEEVRTTNVAFKQLLLLRLLLHNVKLT